MNSKDILDFINANFTMRANVNCYNKLNCFVDAMRNNQYYPITEDEIHRGVEYKKAEGKALLKLIAPIIPEKDKHSAETIVETFCRPKSAAILGVQTHARKINRKAHSF